MQSYFEKKALNYSQIKALLTGIGTYRKEEEQMFYSEKEHFVLGGLTDVISLTPELFESQFCVIQDLESKPSDTIMSILVEAFSNRVSDDIEANYHLIGAAADNHNYYMNRKFKVDEEGNYTRVLQIVESGREYWNAMLQCDNKQIISTEEYNTAKAILDSFYTHKHTSKYFNIDNPDITVINQLAIYFRFFGIDCKALLDKVIYNHKLKVIQPIDIKTIGDTTKAFPKSVKRQRYYIQAYWYSKALKFKYPNYTILPFKFIVESSKHPGILPLVYTMDASYMELAHKEVYEAVELYEWHTENNQWDYDKEIFENNGDLILKYEQS